MTNTPYIIELIDVKKVFDDETIAQYMDLSYDTKYLF